MIEAEEPDSLYPEQMSFVPFDLTSKFKEAGWYAGRRVPVDKRVPAGHPAHRLLGELGGLRLMRSYDDYLVSEVDFEYLPDKYELTEAWERALGMSIIGIGEAHNRHEEMLLSDTGQVFGSSYIHFAFYYIGGTFEEAIRNRMAGTRHRPMLLETETSVELYGREYMRGDPEILHPSSPEFRR